MSRPAIATAVLTSAAAVGVAATIVARPGLDISRRRTPEPARQLVVSVRGEPTGFNRYTDAPDGTLELLTLLTQAPLVRLNRATGLVEPWLADSWSRASDGLTYTLKLRRGIRFSDGAPFSSADALFAFDAVYDPRVNSPLADALKVGGRPLQVSAPDAHTLVVRFPEPYGPGLNLLDNLPILPRHRLAEAWRRGLLNQEWRLNTPLSDTAGLGPFVLEHYVFGQRVVLRRNPRYWRRDEAGRPLPYLDRLVLEIAGDQNTEVLRLEAGAVDLLATEIRIEDYAALKRLEKAGLLRVIDAGVSVDVDALWFNLDPARKPGDPRTAWLQSTGFRKALSHAVNRAAFVSTVYLGAGAPVYGPVTPGNRLYYSPDFPKHEYAPPRAAQILEGLGLRDRDGDGVREDAGGRPARFTLLTQSGHTERTTAASVIQASLGRVGIAVDVVTLDAATLVEYYARGSYDAMYFGVQASSMDPAESMEFWLSSGWLHFWHPSQRTPLRAWERRIDRLMREQMASPDLEHRRLLFAEVQRVFSEEAPALYFGAPHIFVAMRSRVLTAAPVVLRPQLLWNAERLAVRDDL
jgi:peptide/nickel transport system substrate-binding protein